MTTLNRLARPRAKALLVRAVSKLPAGARKAILAQLVRDAGDFNALAELAAKLHVTAVHIEGDYGVFRSSVEDLVIAGTYASLGRWAGPTNVRLQEFFAAHGGGTYVDVGANIGLTTVPVAQNPNVRCFALEPEPINYSHLSENIRTNCPHDNVTMYEIAAFSRKASLRFELATFNRGDHRLRMHDGNEPGILQEETRRTISVEAAPLDAIVAPTTGALAVKMDTQGAEPYVIEGGARTLSSAGLVILEFWPYGMARLGADPEKVIRFLESHFETVSISRNDLAVAVDIPVKTASDDLRRMAATGTDDDLVFVDVIASRETGSRVRRHSE